MSSQELEILKEIALYKKTFPCVRCGYCCTKGVCSYALLEVHRLETKGVKKEETGKTCPFLIEDDPELGTFKCELYSQIVEQEENERYPMFGCGCSSPVLNTIREKVIIELTKRAKKKITLRS